MKFIAAILIALTLVTPASAQYYGNRPNYGYNRGYNNGWNAGAGAAAAIATGMIITGLTAGFYGGYGGCSPFVCGSPGPGGWGRSIPGYTGAVAPYPGYYEGW